MPSSAQNLATTKYVKKHMRRWVLQAHREHEADLVAFLESKDNVNAYLKHLIREDMKKSEN